MVTSRPVQFESIAVATTLADGHGELVTKLKELLPKVTDRFGVVSVVATETTDPHVLALVEASGGLLRTVSPDAHLIGRHRRLAIEQALEQADVERIFYGDLDHVLRWLENDADEFDGIMRGFGTVDCTVIGRGPRSWASLPHRLAETETIVNRIFALMTGHNWDLMMAARGLSRRASEAIVADSDVDTIGNDTAWPLLCRERGFSLAYVEAEGLTYKTNADYAHDRDDERDRHAHEWADRFRIAWQEVEAMIPYMERG